MTGIIHSRILSCDSIRILPADSTSGNSCPILRPEAGGRQSDLIPAFFRSFPMKCLVFFELCAHFHSHSHTFTVTRTFSQSLTHSQSRAHFHSHSHILSHAPTHIHSHAHTFTVTPHPFSGCDPQIIFRSCASVRFSCPAIRKCIKTETVIEYYL